MNISTETQTVETHRLKQKTIGLSNDAGDVQPPVAKKNRSSYFWSQDEQDKLLQLVQDEGLSDWERIAQLLGSNRSAGSVEQYAISSCSVQSVLVCESPMLSEPSGCA